MINDLTEQQKQYVRQHHKDIGITKIAANLYASVFYVRRFMIREKLSFKIVRKNKFVKKDSGVSEGCFNVKEKNWLI